MITSDHANQNRGPRCSRTIEFQQPSQERPLLPSGAGRPPPTATIIIIIIIIINNCCLNNNWGWSAAAVFAVFDARRVGGAAAARGCRFWGLPRVNEVTRRDLLRRDSWWLPLLHRLDFRADWASVKLLLMNYYLFIYVIIYYGLLCCIVLETRTMRQMMMLLLMIYRIIITITTTTTTTTTIIIIINIAETVLVSGGRDAAVLAWGLAALLSPAVSNWY